MYQSKKGIILKHEFIIYKFKIVGNNFTSNIVDLMEPRDHRSTVWETLLYTNVDHLIHSLQNNSILRNSL